MAKGNYSSTGDFKGKRGPNAADGQLTRSDKAGKPPGKAFSELSPENQRKRAESARSAASENVFKSKTGSPEAKKHFKAEQAANRVLGRLKKSRKSAAPPTETRPSREQAAERRRKPLEDRLPGDSAAKLKAIGEAAKANRSR